MDALWYEYDLTDARDHIKCIKTLERICRASLEYDEWQRRCKYRDAVICPICDENYYDYNSKCETHHHPKTLFDIVENILEDHLEKNDLDEVTGLAVVQEIMDLHTFHKVQYVNLCNHCHKKYHDGHPEVQNKMVNLFDERVKVEMAKEVKEEVVVELIASAAPTPIDIPAPVIEKVVDIPAPVIEKLNIETNDGFIEIDIGTL